MGFCHSSKLCPLRTFTTRRHFCQLSKLLPPVETFALLPLIKNLAKRFDGFRFRCLSKPPDFARQPYIVLKFNFKEDKNKLFFIINEYKYILN